MTLKNKYQSVMDQVSVSEEMKDRITAQILNTDLNAVKPAVKKKHLWLRPAAAAVLTAAVLLVVIPLSGIGRMGSAAQPASVDSASQEDGEMMVGSTMMQSETYENVEELSDAAGFTVTEPSYLPFEAEDAVYELLSDGAAEITWHGTNGEYASMQVGQNEQPAESYQNQKTVTVNGTEVKLYGMNAWGSASFEDVNGNDCVLAFDPEIDIDQMEAVIQSILK